MLFPIGNMTNRMKDIPAFELTKVSDKFAIADTEKPSNSELRTPSLSLK
jgi:hypothetical protein